VIINTSIIAVLMRSYYLLQISSLIVGCCLLYPPLAASFLVEYENDYDNPLDFQCKPNTTLQYLSSHHDNRHEDRIWSLSCHPAEGYVSNCLWSGMFLPLISIWIAFEVVHHKNGCIMYVLFIYLPYQKQNQILFRFKNILRKCHGTIR